MKRSILATIGIGVLVGLAPVGTRAQNPPVSLNPTDDTFTRQNAPNATLGAAGAIHVSGADATNEVDVAQGVADGWLKFDTTAAVIRFDAEFGSGLWEIASATLRLDEVAAPGNRLFNRGVGRIKVFWVARDNWTEGVGRPQGQGTGVGDVLTFTSSAGIRDADLDEPLGVFANNGTDGPFEVPLDLTDSLTADLESGGPVSIVLTAIDASTGFTFHSRTWRRFPDNRVSLLLTARLIVEDAPVVDVPVTDVPVQDQPVEDTPTTDNVPTDMVPDVPTDMNSNTNTNETTTTSTPPPSPGMCGVGAPSAAMVMLAFFAVMRLQRVSPVSRRRR